MTLPILPSIATWLLSAVLVQPVPAADVAAIADAATTAPATAVDALLAQLADEDVDRRDAAQRQLLAAGDDVLPALEAARLAAQDADVQLRLDALLVQVQERVDVGASRITLQFADAPLDVVLEALGRQARTDFGNNLVDEFGGPTAVPRVTLDLVGVSFWRAIEEIQANANVVFMPQQEGWRASRNFGQGMQARGSESGAFLVQPMSLNYTRTVSYMRNMADGESFNLQFQAMAEPKVRLANGQGSVRIDRAVDSNGNDLLAAQRAQSFGTGNGQSTIGCNVMLKYPRDAGATISELSGTLRLTLARRVESVTSDDLVGQGKVEATIEGARITVAAVTPEADANVGVDAAERAVGKAAARRRDGSPVGALVLRVSVDGDAGGAIAQRMQANFQQQLRLVDGRGNPMRVVNVEQVRADGRVAELKLTYQPSQPQNSRGPYKLRLEVPTGYREVDVPFTLRDLKMP